MSSNLDAFLMTTRKCEGTDAPDGYQALFGYRPGNGRIFDNGFARHPNIKSSFRQTDGTTNYTTAAGAYQFLFSTWTRLQAKLDLPDFSPASQDAAAAELIAEAGAMSDVKEGRLQDAIDKCAKTWASLPASTYPQPVRSYVFATEAYAEAGGTFA